MRIGGNVEVIVSSIKILPCAGFFLCSSLGKKSEFSGILLPHCDSRSYLLIT